MKLPIKHLSLLSLIFSLGLLVVLTACVSVIPVDLPAGTPIAAAPTDTPETVDTPAVEETVTLTETPTAEATDAPTDTPVVEEETITPTATETAAMEPTETPTATETASAKKPTATATKRRAVTPTAMKRPTRTPTRTPTPDPRFSVAISEADLNKSVRDAIAQNASLNVDNVNIDLRPGVFVATGRAVLGFFPVNLELHAKVGVKNGKAVPEITDVIVNGSPAAGFVRNQVINMISPYLGQMTDLGEDVIVEKVEVKDKELAISGRWK
ncbi:MAG: hypothetical protein J5I90_16570 [Caldilineales bacterium]|nr:hypothetical protein [Caldilineales bacterium]